MPTGRTGYLIMPLVLLNSVHRNTLFFGVACPLNVISIAIIHTVSILFPLLAVIHTIHTSVDKLMDNSVFQTLNGIALIEKNRANLDGECSITVGAAKTPAINRTIVDLKETAAIGDSNSIKLRTALFNILVKISHKTTSMCANQFLTIIV
jgi:hypothetical protein